MAEEKDDADELPPELAEFIDRVIVPLLVEQWKQRGHLYNQDPAYYDGQSGLADAA